MMNKHKSNKHRDLNNADSVWPVRCNIYIERPQKLLQNLNNADSVWPVRCNIYIERPCESYSLSGSDG